MIRLLWEDISLNNLEFAGTQEKQEIERALREQVSTNIANYLTDEKLLNDSLIGDDFSVLDECDEELDNFSEEDNAHIIFPFEVLIENKNISSQEDIQQEYLEQLVTKIEKGLCETLDSVIRKEAWFTRICFIKAYYEED